MTVSTSPCSKRLELWQALRGLLLALLVVWALPQPAPALAADLQTQFVEILPVDDQYVLNAAFSLPPSPRLEELVTRGVALPFVLEFNLKSPRWYWWDAVVVEKRTEYRLSYNALTRQYRLSTGGLQRSFTTLDETLRAMLSLHNWPLIDRDRLPTGRAYSAELRLRLDQGLLPKPFQIAALGDSDLDISSGWQRWTFQTVPREAPREATR